MQSVEVTLNPEGYLHLSAAVARQCFPSDALVVTQEKDALLFWPMHGVAAGGLLLKQRNLNGDRSVLIREMLPNGSTPGNKEASWNERRSVLILTFDALRLKSDPVWRIPKDSLGVNSFVEHEKGRWVVYLEVGFWDEHQNESPLRVERRRIADYPTERRATIAAEWMRRGADRSPPGKAT